jgi:hypothetical protein
MVGTTDIDFEVMSSTYTSSTNIYSPKKEKQHVKKYNLLKIFNIILNAEISITLL